jgi:hypothetical protein
LQGVNNAALVAINNTLKRELAEQQNQLLIDHQDETIIDGGAANTTQFHYILSPTSYERGANFSMTPTGPTGTNASGVILRFDANQGATGTANYVFPNRRDLLFRQPADQ